MPTDPLELPEPVADALRAVIDTRREWSAAPTDRDHHVRHAAADKASAARRRFDKAIDQWIAEASR